MSNYTQRKRTGGAHGEQHDIGPSEAHQVLTPDEGAFIASTVWTAGTSPPKWRLMVFTGPSLGSMSSVRNILVNGTARSSDSGVTIISGWYTYATLQGLYPLGYGPVYTTATVQAP